MREGWLLAELEQRFGFGLEELARQFDRSVSWVSRRLAWLSFCRTACSNKYERAKVSAQVAMKYLVPVARGSLEDCQQIAEAFARHKFTSRQAGQLSAAWHEASPQIPARLLEQPQLFLKVQREAEPAAACSLQELLRDLEMVAAIAHGANGRLRKMHDQCEPPQEEQSEMLRDSLALGLQELQRLATRIPEVKPEKEEHVESASTNHDSGTTCTGSEETRDRAGVGHLSSDGAQGASFQLRRSRYCSVRRRPNLIGNRSWSCCPAAKGISCGSMKSWPPVGYSPTSPLDARHRIPNIIRGCAFSARRRSHSSSAYLRRSSGSKVERLLLIILKFHLKILTCGTYLEIWIKWPDKRPNISPRWL
jgi:hypothetical protein